jgi:hypothetical protein
LNLVDLRWRLSRVGTRSLRLTADEKSHEKKRTWPELRSRWEFIS